MSAREADRPAANPRAAKSKEPFRALPWCQTNAKILCGLPDSDAWPAEATMNARARKNNKFVAQVVFALAETESCKQRN